MEMPNGFKIDASLLSPSHAHLVRAQLRAWRQQGPYFYVDRIPKGTRPGDLPFYVFLAG
jgi:hypothetical protein